MTDDPRWPTATDRELARIEIKDCWPEEYPEDLMRTTLARNLKPGDQFVARGVVHTCTQPPDLFRMLDEVRVPVSRRTHILGAVVFTLDRRVIAWSPPPGNGRGVC